MTGPHRTVLVLGLGDSGLAMARWSARRGAAVRVWDSRDSPPQAAALAEHVPEARRLGGELDDAAFDGVSLVLQSPGLAPDDPRIAQPLAAAQARGVPVQRELDLFSAALAQLREERGYRPQLVAITGTNGKTTTTAMTALLVERSGRRVAMAGNVGPTLLQTLADALDREDESTVGPQPEGRFEHLPEVWVLELSSFQLDQVEGFEPDAAALLNITQDHLDWHGSLEAYTAAKARVFGTSSVMVVNRDDPAVEALVPALPSPAAPARKGRGVRPAARREVIRFGLGAPQHAGDYGLVVEHGMAWLVRAQADEASRGRHAASEPVRLQRLMPADALRVRGRHNAANALAALALAGAIGCALAPMLHALREYRGEPHRVEHVATIGGVDAFDDSKGTNVGATVAALNGLGADRAPARLAVILGGDGKGQDFTPLVEPLRRHARAIATLGRDAARIEELLQQAGLPFQRHASLEAATRWCFEQSRPGDAVLLSPACASLDMFRNYPHRAAVFVGAVRELAAEHGELAS